MKSGVVRASGNGINPNILLGTHRPEFSTTTGAANEVALKRFSGGSGGNGSFSITIDDVPVGMYSYNVTGNTSGNRDFQQRKIPYKAGTTYTSSWYAKGNGTCLHRIWNSSKGSAQFSHSYTLTDEWTFHSYTFTATQTMQDQECSFHLGVTGVASIQICGMKLQEGSIATPWCLNEDDDDFVGMGAFMERSIARSSIGDDYIIASEFLEI